ncbi:MAG TPA: hypothetical protein PLJ16_04215 [Casimicrobium huifangae]|uniref:hypothetical protein n=1 Tax=Casimicrobium huifangae TaxID=2591109 RepID=UPI0012EB308B|nr:hypothetical protein [Casimicrobium huifangae]HQA33351.1 hypothetical protein [Casimicrobium huifangae]HQD64409.1 hypothetical protein [Casimicrobium huifangae]
MTDSSPLGSVGGARKFAASLDRDIFSATDVVCAQLRAFISEAEHKETLAASPLLELDARLEATTTRLERDYLAASLQSHSLRERLWDSGYDWAMRFADAYRAILMRETASVAGRAATEFARVAARFFWFRTMAYRFRLYRHEEWIPGIWAETHQVFRKTCDLGVDHVIVDDISNAGQPTFPARAFSVLLLLRVGNAGGYTPSQIHALYRKIEEFTHDIRLTARPASDGGFAINLSGTDGLVPRHSVPQGGQYLYCDTTTIHARALAWLDQVEAEDGGRNVTLGGSLSQNPLLALRSAVLRIDPEFKPLARASQRSDDRGRVAATYGVNKVATAISYDPALLASSIEGDTYEYADALEIETIGTLKASTLKRLRRDLPPDAARLNLQFWHLRDRSDTGFRCVVPNTSTQRLRLRDIAVVTEEAPAAGWQVATIVRLLKLPAGHIELGLQVLSRDIDMVELRTLRSRQGLYRDNAATMVASAVFKAIRLKSAFFGRPIMGATWIMNTVDYQASVVYEVQGSGRRYEASEVISEGSDWVWVRPNELS